MMCKSYGIISIVLLLNLLFQLPNPCTAELRSFNRSYSYPEKQVIYNDFSINEGTLVYAVCDEGGSIHEKTCTIIHRKFPYDEVTYSCDVTLRVRHPENYNLSSRLSLHVLGQDNAILSWTEMGQSPKFNLMPVHLSSCTTRVVEVDDRRAPPDESEIYPAADAYKIVTYGNFFDVFFEGTRDKSAQDQVGVRIDLNGKTQPINNIIENEKDRVWLISPIVGRSTDNGYVYTTTREDGSGRIKQVKPDGRTFVYPESGRLITSANYEMITVCVKSKSDSIMNCTQYSENGDIKFKVTLPHDYKKAHETSTVRTTRRGGFLLVTTAYHTFSERVNYDKIIHYDVVKANGLGDNKGRIRLNTIVDGHYNEKILSVWEHGDEYCTTLVSQTSMREDNLQIVVNCFDDSDFLV